MLNAGDRDVIIKTHKHHLKGVEMRLFRFLFMLVLMTALVGCQTVPATHRVHHSLLDSPPKVLPKKVLLLPASLEVFEISAGGVAEKVEDWSRQAAAHADRGLKSYAASNASFQLVEMPPLSPQEKESLDQHLALYDMVAADAFQLTRVGGPAWQHKVKHFDYALGDGLRFLKQKTGADAALVVVGLDQISSADRKAMVLVAALFGVGIPLGISFLSTGVVDLESGDILWFNYATSYANRDLRKPEDADAMIKEMFVNYPGLEPYAQLAAGP